MRGDQSLGHVSNGNIFEKIIRSTNFRESLRLRNFVDTPKIQKPSRKFVICGKSFTAVGKSEF